MRIYKVYIDYKDESWEYPEWKSGYSAFYTTREKAEAKEAEIAQQGVSVFLESFSYDRLYDYGISEIEVIE